MATVDSAGHVTAVGEGAATITASSQGVVGESQLTVSRPGPVVTLSASATSVAEGGTLALTVHVEPTSADEITVAYELGPDGDPATADADAGDFASDTEGTVTIRPGQTTSSFSVIVNDDADIEPAREVFAVTLSPPPGGSEWQLGSAENVTLVGAINEGVCDRTSQVRDEILERLGTLEQLLNLSFNIDGCHSVTPEHLARVTFLNLGWWEGKPHAPIESLKARDFMGLDLEGLQITGHGLKSLPDGIFAGLHNLERLSLYGNELSSLSPNLFADLHALTFLHMFGALDEVDPPALPRDLFSDLINLRELHLGNPRWATLPEGLFAGLVNMRVLNLNGCSQLESLPPRLFADLSNLEELHMMQNGLDELPAGFFVGLPNLRKLNLLDSPGAPFSVAVKLERVDTADVFAPGPATVRAATPAGFPFGFSTPILVAGGTASADEILVVQGAEATQEFSVTSSAGSEGSSVFVSLRLPPVPTEFQGLQLVAPDPLVLFQPSTNKRPVVEGAAPHQVLQVGGPSALLDLARYFSEPDGDTLAYAVAWEPGQQTMADAEIQGSRLELAPRAAGEATVTLTASDPEGFVAWQDMAITVLASPDPERFDIDIVFLSRGTSEQETAAREAAARWEDIVTNDLPDVPMANFSGCTGLDANVNLVLDRVDDLVVFVQYEQIAFAGLAGICAIRQDGLLPYMSEVSIHWDLKESGITSLHELGHALGFGTGPAWDALLRNPSRQSAVEADTHFAGARAIAAFDAAGGTSYRAGGKVPVENSIRVSVDSHWRASVLKGELMNPSGGTNFIPLHSDSGGFLSATTVQALADLGYDVNVGEADEYLLSWYADAATADDRREASARTGGISVNFGDDVIRGPVWVADERGELVRVLRP